MGKSSGSATRKKPVPFNAARRKAYLEKLREGISHVGSAGSAGVSYETARAHREADPVFGDEAERAYNAGTSALEEAALKRARLGSDTLLIFALKQRGWSDRQHVQHEGSISFNISGQWMDGSGD